MASSVVDDRMATSYDEKLPSVPCATVLCLECRLCHDHDYVQIGGDHAQMSGPLMTEQLLDQPTRQLSGADVVAVAAGTHNDTFGRRGLGTSPPKRDIDTQSSTRL